MTERARTADAWPSRYACLGRDRWIDAANGYSLQTIRRDDRVPIRRWRNEQIDVLRQAEPLSEADQDRYFDDVVRPQLDEVMPDQILVTLWREDGLLGYGGLVHINWLHARAEVSFLADPVRIAAGCYEDDFLAYLGLICCLARDELRLHRLTGETFPERFDHVRIFESFGFVREGRLIEHRKTEQGFQDSLVHGLLLDQTGGA